MNTANECVLRVSCSDEHLDGFDYFVVEIGPDYARLLLERIKMFESIRARDQDAYELYFWDYSGQYFRGDPDEPGEVREPSRAECNQLVVREDEVLWTAIPKHTDVYVTTDSIKTADLAEVAGSLR